MNCSPQMVPVQEMVFVNWINMSRDSIIRPAFYTTSQRMQHENAFSLK